MTGSPGVGAGRRSRVLFWAGLAVVSVAGVALRASIGPVIRWGAVYDDENQMRVALGLLSGQWLGQWGTQTDPSLTLSKGPGYPLFLVAARSVSLSPHVAAYLVLLVGALLLALLVRRLVGAGWALAMYAAIAFCPNLFAVTFSRPYRDQLVASLVLVALGAAGWAGLAVRSPSRWGPSVRLALATLGLAGALGWLAITRADTVWVGVTCALLVLVVALAREPGADVPVSTGRGRSLLRLVVPVLVVVAAVLSAPAAVAAENDQVYGVRLADDYSTGGFAQTMRWWVAVDAPGGEPFQLVTRPQREAVYAVSPAARVVQSRLEDPANPWIGVGCGERPPGAGPCTEYGAFFGWAIRNAAYAAGYRTASSFQDYFVTLAGQISSACRSGALRCETPPPVPDLPPLSHLSVGVTASGTGNLVLGSLLFTDNTDGPQQPVPSDATLVGQWERVIPDVNSLVQALDRGETPQAIARNPVVDALRSSYVTLGAVALVLVLLGAIRGAFRRPAGRLALVLLVGWLLNIGIVAVVFGATNRQFVRVVPSYTLAGQPLIVAALVLGIAAAWAGRPRRGIRGDAARESADAGGRTAPRAPDSTPP